MKVYINLKPLAEDIKAGSLKAKKLVEVLLNEGFRTEKEVEKASLSDLSYNGKSIKSCKIDTWQIVAHVNVG